MGRLRTGAVMPKSVGAVSLRTADPAAAPVIDCNFLADDADVGVLLADRRVLNGIFWVLRSGAPWRDLPICYGPRTTCYNRFVRWRRAGVWGRIMDSLAAAHDAAVQMIDTSVVRVHQHAACIARNRSQSMGRSRGGLTSKIHAVVDTNGLPVRLELTAGEAHDNRLALSLLSRLRSGSMLPG
jgi:transposase